MLGLSPATTGTSAAARHGAQQQLHTFTRFVSLVDSFFVAGRSL
jgi:hypothetical protein